MSNSVGTQDEYSEALKIAALWKHYFYTRDTCARAELIDHYMQFARIMAGSLYKLRATNAVSFDDYLQYARTGLLESIDRFDPNREVRFEAFAAIRIRGSVLNGLEVETELAAQIKARSLANLSERLNSICEAGKNKQSAQSLEGWVNTVVSVALGVLLTDPDESSTNDQPAANPYASVELLHVRKRLLSGVAKLSPREALIIRMHYFEHEEFQLIAEQLKISKGRVSQLHAQALEKLKHMLKTSADSEFDL